MSASGDRIEHVGEGPIPDPELATQTVLGPCLTISLALNGIFCLHASAVRFGGAVVAFVGESGTGKSTLASSLARRPGFDRVADDQLPVTLTPLAVAVKPCFPQLKWSQEQQWKSPHRLPLASINLLLLTDSDSRLERTPLGNRDVVVAILRHTVAARLFDNDLRERHLDFATLLASQIPVLKLLYPRDQGLNPRLLQTLDEDVASVPNDRSPALATDRP